MTIKYPTDCDTSGKRTEYLYRAQELLREVHNHFSDWAHKGELTMSQYKDFPRMLTDKYPYALKLSKRDLKKFLEEDFTPRSDRICQEICVQRAAFKKSAVWPIDVGEI